MAQKKALSQSVRDGLSLSVSARSTVSFADYYYRKPLFPTFMLQNDSSEAVLGLRLCFSDDIGLLLAEEKQVEEIPYNSSLVIPSEQMLSPTVLAAIETPTEDHLHISLLYGDTLLSEITETVTVLPFSALDGLSGNMENIAGFVRPRLPECGKILSDAMQQTKKWKGESAEPVGYIGMAKNDVRLFVAAVYVALKKRSFRLRELSMESAFTFTDGDGFPSGGEYAPIELALFAAAVLEAAGLHAVIALGDRETAVGAWLYESCSVDGISDDIPFLKRQISAGVNGITLFDVMDLYNGKNGNYTTSEKHAADKVGKEAYTMVADIKRLRFSHILPLPVKPKGNGKKLVYEKDFFDAAPELLPDARDYSVSGLPKSKQWERRLLDLSQKNALLNFNPGRNLHIYMPDTVSLLAMLPDVPSAEITVFPERSEQYARLLSAPDFSPLGADPEYAEVARLELQNRVLRAVGSKSATDEALRYVLRKSRAAEEETGAKVLYLAVGFLHWKEEGENESFYAPILLQPVTLRKISGRGYGIAASDDGYEINTTLLEFLHIEFGIDIRGLAADLPNRTVAEVFAAFRTAIADRAGWELSGDVYLAAFSFSRYAMWNDIRENMPLYSQNPLIRSLTEGKSCLPAPPEIRAEDDTPMGEILLPLPADASQYEALAEAETGASFVLHGPPGTGKSQTITNLIVNALYRGKRVLFVAEKQAALAVVEKRLESVGVGDFCLELHAGKTDKQTVAEKIAKTLALKETEAGTELPDMPDAQLSALRDSLREPVAALHKKRRLGVSIYEAILLCMHYKTAPELFDIESSFYDGLTKEKVAAYKDLLTTAAAAARECGGIYDTPFSNVNIQTCDDDTKRSITAAANVLMADQKNLRAYLTLFLETLGQKVSLLTTEKLHNLDRLAALLREKTYASYFAVGEDEYIRFFHASMRLQTALTEYDKRYKTIISLSREECAAVDAEIENWGNNYRSSAKLSEILRKLRRAAIGKLAPEDELRDIVLSTTVGQSIYDLADCKELSRAFFERFSGFSRKKHAEFFAPIAELQDLAASVFMDYNADSFHVAALRAASGYADPIFDGFRRAVVSFENAVAEYNRILSADPAKAGSDDVLQYYRTKASALLDNLDMLPALCSYRRAASELERLGLSFLTSLLEAGTLRSDNLVESFEKNVYRNFLETAIPADPVLSRFSAGVLEENIEKFRLMAEKYDRATGLLVRKKLLDALPTMQTEGPLSLELLAFQRMSKQMRGIPIRDLFREMPELMRVAAPCLLMSPITVSQYLPAELDLFDLVVFDEASQMPTSEAVPSLARSRAAIVVGDEKQLPPTAFFHSAYADEENLANEDMESVLEEWLTLGLPERHLTWHYRSKHESLIAFSNAMYYANRLKTFPSPDALESKVKFTYVADGVYERGGSKANRAEAEALVAEVIRRLKDQNLEKSSIGIVTFSTAQQEFLEKLLTREITKENLETVAYEREEPLFVKNLENVQGDERDVILFSVCYGPDQKGKVSLNFGPLNQYGGWRRLNVAVSRAREEMQVFSSLTSAMIDLSRTSSKGVAGLKAFLEFAEKGKSSAAVREDELRLSHGGIGHYIADELKLFGYECRVNLGVSDFKIDVAVLDPRNKKEYILAILCDANPDFPVRDRDVLQLKTLKRANWNVLRVFTLNFYNNPKREAKRIRDVLERLAATDGKTKTDPFKSARKPYKAAKLEERSENASFVTSGENDEEILSRLRAITAAEEPISRDFLIRRCLAGLGIQKTGAKLEGKMDTLLGISGLKTTVFMDTVYYFRSEKVCNFDHFRVENGTPLRRSESDISHYELLAVIEALLSAKVSVYLEEITETVAREFRFPKVTDRLTKAVEDAIAYGEKNGLFIRSIADKITLA